MVADTLPCLAEELVMALLVRLLRTGAITEADIAAMTTGTSEEVRHLLNCAVIEAATEPPAGPNLRIVKSEG